MVYFLLIQQTLSSSFLCPLKLIYTATPDTTQTGLFCRVWCGGVNWVGPTARQVRSASECVGRRSATAGRTCRAVGPTQFTPPDSTQSCRFWRALWISHKIFRWGCFAPRPLRPGQLSPLSRSFFVLIFLRKLKSHLFRHYFVTVCVIRHSGPCSFLLIGH